MSKIKITCDSTCDLTPELYEKYGVPLSLCGHLHMQHIARSNNLTEIAASSLAVSPNQYGVLQVKDNQLLEYRMQPLDVSAWAKRTNQTNTDLMHFSQYASDFFNRTTHAQTSAMFTSSMLSPQEQQSMIDFAVQLNAQYFSGNRSLTADHPAWAMWQQHLPSSFFTYYMSSILAEPAQDMRFVSFRQPLP